MIGTIGPLVEAGEKKRKLALHLAGGISGGMAIGIVAGFIGVAITTVVPRVHGTAPLAIAGLLCYGTLVELNFVQLPHLTIERQTPGVWPCALGDKPAVFAWGADLGLGVTTRIPSQLALAVPAGALAVGSLPFALAMTRHHDEARAVGTAQVMVAAANVDEDETSSLERPHDCSAADAR